MQYILHDAQVAWWAFRTKHRDRNFKIEILWPVSIKPVNPFYRGAWIVHFIKPGIYLTNPRSVRLDYLYAHRGSSSEQN